MTARSYKQQPHRLSLLLQRRALLRRLLLLTTQHGACRPCCYGRHGPELAGMLGLHAVRAARAALQVVGLLLLLHLKLRLHQVLVAKQLLHVDKAELRQVAHHEVCAREVPGGLVACYDHALHP